MGFSFNGSTKRIVCGSGTVSIDLYDLYSRWKEWALTDDNSKYLPAFDVVGGDPIDADNGLYITAYFFLINGWKIKPQESSHTLAVRNGVLLTEDGSDPFVATNGSYTVMIRYNQPVKTETVNREGGSSGGGASVEELAAAILANPSNRLTTDSSGRVTVGSNADKTGYQLTQAFPTNFAALQIASNGRITVGANYDKTGYQLTQSFPTNFASLLIVDGKVEVNGELSGGASSEEIAAAILSNPSNKLQTNSSGQVVAASLVDKTGFASSQASDIAAAILSNPSNKLQTNSSGQVVASTVVDKSGFGTTLTVSEIAAAILSNPSNKIVTDSTGNVALSSSARSLLAHTVLTSDVSVISQDNSVGRKLASLEDSPAQEVVMALQGSPVAANGDLTVIRGDDYHPEYGALSTIQWSNEDWTDLSRSGLLFQILDGETVVFSSAATFVAPNSVQLDLSSKQTSTFPVGQWSMKVLAQYTNQRRRHLVRGTITVL